MSEDRAACHEQLSNKKALGRDSRGPLRNILLSDLFNQGLLCPSVLRYKFQIRAVITGYYCLGTSAD